MQQLVAVSNSEIATWDRCRRQWYLKYYLGMVPTDESPVSNQWLGIRIHAALEAMYGYEMDPLHVLNLLYALAIEERPDSRIDLLAERELAVTMVAGYLEWVSEGGTDALFTVVNVEQDVQIQFPRLPGVTLRARLDQVVWDEMTESLMFLDHKTAANFEAHEMLDINPQFKFYSVIQRLAAGPDGPRVMGGMINTLRRVKRTAKSKPPYYLRDRIRYNDEQLDSAEARIGKFCTEILEARASLDYAYDPVNGGGGALELVNAVQRFELPPSPRTHECRWDCPFVSVCPMMDDGSDWPGMLTRSGRFRQDDPYSYYHRDPLRTVREAMSEKGELNPDLIGERDEFSEDNE